MRSLCYCIPRPRVTVETKIEIEKVQQALSELLKNDKNRGAYDQK